MRRVLESLFSVEADFVYVFDRELRYQFVNPAGARLLGMTPEQMVGKTWGDLFTAEQMTTEAARVASVLATREPARSTRKFTRDDGRTRTYEHVMTPIFGESGDIELIVSRGRDITDRLLADERSARLQLLTQRLAATLAREEIGQIVIEHVHELLGASASVAYFAHGDGTMHLAAHRSVSPETLARRAVLPLDAPVPLAAAIRTGVAQWYEKRDDMVRDYPNLTSATVVGSTLEATAAIPLVLGTRTFGGIAFSFPRPTQFDDATRSLIATIALQCAVALDRARLFDEERRARHRLTVLAETSDRLTRARLDLAQVLETVCREVATRMPDSCTINLVNTAGTHLELAATHHINPAAELGIREVLMATPVKIGEGSLGGVAASGEPLMIPVVPFEQLVAAARPEYRSHLERFPIGSLLVVPLRVAERVIGTVTTSRLRGQPAYTDDDKQLLQDLADRAAFAIENARLFEAESKARQMRDDFLSIAGHELRTPLAAMQLQLESLHEHAAKGTFAAKPELLVERLDKSLRHLHRLTHLISQVLDVSQLVRGRLAVVREAVDLRAVVEEIVERFSAQAARVGSALVYEPGGPIIGSWDRGRLDQVITNLVDNAIKYGAGKPILITTSTDASRARLVVHDEGVGVAPDARERIFGRFERAVSRNYGGLGLGLWISRQIVDALGGTISLDTQGQVGSTFVVELPLQPDSSS